MAEETDITQVQMALEDLTNAMTATIGIAFTDTNESTEPDAIDATGQALQQVIKTINGLPDYRLQVIDEPMGTDEKARYTAVMKTLERKQQEAQEVLRTAQRQLDEAMMAYTQK